MFRGRTTFCHRVKKRRKEGASGRITTYPLPFSERNRIGNSPPAVHPIRLTTAKNTCFS